MTTLHARARASMIVAVVGAFVALLPASVAAQEHQRSTSMPNMPGMAGMAGAASDTVDPALSSANMAMSGGMMETAHMRMTARRPANAADEARADSIAAQLRAAIGKYRDYHVALRDGFRPFLPDVPQHVYHFTSRRNAVTAAFHFDPSAPTSLLYEKTADGGYTLVGAMYTAPRTASLDDLNVRVPLSVGQWHEHVNLCVPRRGQLQRLRETANGKPLFGPEGSITTAAACEAAGGRFVPQLFGWMIHVHPFASTRAAVWAPESHGATPRR